MKKRSLGLLSWLVVGGVSLLLVGCPNTGTTSGYVLSINPATIAINQSSVATVKANQQFINTLRQDVLFSLESQPGTKANSFASLSSESCIISSQDAIIKEGSGCSVTVQAESSVGTVKIYAFVVNDDDSATHPVTDSPLTLTITSSTPTPTPTTAYKTLFITESAYDGNLGGISGADAKCQAEATAASLSGTYKALVIESQRYPCDDTGECGTGHMHDWPLAVSTDYANAADGSVVILTTNANGVFESSYAQNLIKSATGQTVSAFFWTGISGVQISGKANASEPATMSKWSYADESQSWHGTWGAYTQLSCNGWTTTVTHAVSVGDNGLYADESYERGNSITVESGYAVQNIANSRYPALPAVSRWLTSVSEHAVLSTCDSENHLICVEQALQ